MKLNISRIVFLAVFIPLIVLSGCKKEEEIGPPVQITSTTPQAAYGNDEVTLQGSNFHTVKAVFVGDKHAVVVGSSESSITFIVPDNAASGPNSITLAMANNYRVAIEFEVLVRPVPRIDAISPSAAAEGEDVTIAGINLDNLETATLGGIPVEIVSATNTELIFRVPGGLQQNTPAVIELATSEASVASTSTFYVGTNLIANSDFEAGSGDNFEEWEKLNGGADMTEVTGDQAYFGRSIRVVGAGANPWNTQLASSPTPLNFGSEYTILLWAKAEATGAIMRTSASQFDGNGADYFYGNDVEIATEWTQYSWTFTVGKDLPTHKIVLDMGTTTVPFAIDNVTLIETGSTGPEIPSDLLADGGFENGLYPSGTPDGVASWQILNGAIEVTNNPDEVHCNDQAIKVTGAGANPWDTQLAADVVALDFDETYEVKLWAKAAGPGGVMRVSASRWNNSNGDDYFYGADVTIAEEWTEYSWIFTVGKDIPEGHHIVLDMGTSNQVFFIDDVSLTKYVEPFNILPDGGFEDGLYPSGTPDGVASWQILNGMLEITTADGEFVDGGQALKVTGAGANPWDTQLAADVVALNFEGRYGVKLMAKAAGPGAVMRVSASRWNNSNGDDYFYGDDVTLTEEWAEYSWEFTVGKDIPDGHHIVLDMGVSNQVFFIDNVVLYEIPAFVCK